MIVVELKRVVEEQQFGDKGCQLRTHLRYRTNRLLMIYIAVAQ